MFSRGSRKARFRSTRMVTWPWHLVFRSTVSRLGEGEPRPLVTMAPDRLFWVLHAVDERAAGQRDGVHDAEIVVARQDELAREEQAAGVEDLRVAGLDENDVARLKDDVLRPERQRLVRRQAQRDADHLPAQPAA